MPPYSPSRTSRRNNDYSSSDSDLEFEALVGTLTSPDQRQEHINHKFYSNDKEKSIYFGHGSDNIIERIQRKYSRRRIAIILVALFLCLVTPRYLKIVKRYEKNSFYLHYRKKYDRCTFVSNGPKPVLLISLGRSGSSITWQTISSMAGIGQSTIAHEITGGNKLASMAFFDDIQDHIGDDWVWLKLCNVQRYYLNKMSKEERKFHSQPGKQNIAGFQWKPYRATFDHHYAISGLEKIAKMDVKVIFLTRNALDRYISNRRHKGYQHSEEVPAHCAVDDTDCIKRHQEHSKGVTIEPNQDLLNRLNGGVALDQMVLDRLSTLGIKHLHVTYEDLYNSSDGTANEWLRINRFLGVGPQDGLTMTDVSEHFEFAPTSAKHHSETIANYDEVKTFLETNGMDRLLH